MLRTPSSDEPAVSASQSTGSSKDARAVRLAEESRRLVAEFAFHPAITIIPVSGNPPEAYQVEYRVRSIVFDAAHRKLQYVDRVALVLTLGADYPGSPPMVQPPQGLFLPNSDGEQLQIRGAWNGDGADGGDWLADLLPKLGALLAYRTYDPDSVVNVDALNWQEANVAGLPTDKSTDFSRSAGGAPTERIGRYAEARIAEVRGVLESTCQRLAAGAIQPDAIADTATQAKYVLLPLLQNSPDAAIAAVARELTAWADALADSLPAWQELNERQARLMTVRSAIDGIAHFVEPLNEGLIELSTTFTGSPASKPGKALAQIPSASVMAPLVMRLSAALAAAQHQEARSRKAMAQFADFDASHPPPSPIAAATTATDLDSPMEKLLAPRQSALAADCEQLAARAGPALEQLVELLRRARAEITALQRLADWRAYLDGFVAGSVLAREVLEQGAAGVQAYLLDCSGQTFGPYQFEQSVHFGPMQLAVGREGETLQIIDAATGDVVGSRSAASVSLRLPIDGGETTLTVRASADCLAIANRLDSARTRTFESLSRLHESVPESRSWCGGLLAVLCAPAALAALHAEHRRSAHRWDRLAADLLLLMQLKDRLATYYLVQRSAPAARELAQKRADAEKKVIAANQRLAALAARCDRDPNTDKLLVPPQLADAYGQATADRQSAKKEIQRIDRRERALADRIGARLIDTSRIGRAEIPTFRRLGEVSSELVEAARSASDEALSTAVSALAGQLRVTFPGVIASAPVDLSNRRREKRPADPTASPPSDAIEADEALALRPEDSMADVAAVSEAEELEAG